MRAEAHDAAPSSHLLAREGRTLMRMLASLALVAALFVDATPGAAAPEGQMTWGVHVTLAPTWFDPAETPGIGTPFMILYEFVLRPGVKFHNGDPVTADDVKFSFERYRGAASRLLKERVPVVEVVDAGFKKAPVGAGPYKFVSFNPGIELVLEANEQYWRKAPSVKRLVLKAVPDEATRLAMLKRGEADIVYLLQSELAEEVRRTAGLTLRPTPIVSTHWLVFLDQWDPKSPWADRRVRLAANHAIDRQTMNDAITLGFSRITWSIIPQSFDFFWQPPAYAHDPALAKRLLAEAGYPNGFDAGDLWCEPATATMSEAVANDLRTVGIRTRLRPLERAAFFKSYQEKKLKNLAYSISGAFGNAPIRLETFVVAGGPFVYGSYPDIDVLFREQAAELDRKRREATLHHIQQLVHEKAMYAPIWELGFIHAQGPRVAESGLGLITGWAFSAPYEDVKLKPR